jgi:hypothetical protein
VASKAYLLNPTVRAFAPQQWGQVERFAKLYDRTFTDFGKAERRAVSGLLRHFRKALIMKNLAEQLRPNLHLDMAELETAGYSTCNRSSELSAVVESVFTELYSAIDCACKIVVAVYRPTRGMPTDSTRRLFQKIQQSELDGILDETILQAFKGATWYQELRTLRDELTHFDIGFCYWDRTTDKVVYMHEGLGTDVQALVIDDIFERLQRSVQDVNLFLGEVFAHLNTRFANTPVIQFCGIFGGRLYTREVIPSEAIDWNSGVCLSHEWFEREENPTCPFSSDCGAYKRAEQLS